MTSSLFLKRSFQSGTTPAASEITSSELAINLGDGGLYYLNVTSSQVELIRAGTASFAQTASFALNAGEGTNTGSFTGSFTGSLQGTASFAETASLLLGLVESASFAETASFVDPVAFTAFRPIKTVANTNPYNVTAQDHTLLMDASSGSAAIVVQLPGVALFMSGPAARIIHIIKVTGSNDVEIISSGSETVVLNTSAILIDIQQGLTLHPSGSNWWAI